MDSFQETLQVTCQLHANRKLSRSDVQFVIETVENYITSVYNPFLYNNISNNICNTVGMRSLKKSKIFFKNRKIHFQHLIPKIKECAVIKKIGLYKEPDQCYIARRHVQHSVERKLNCKIKVLY